jgi:hypothetical protein
MDTLKRLLAYHRKIKFPEFPSNDEFSEWVEELIETDGYYMGLLLSLSEGAKVRLNNIALNQLKSKLESFESLSQDHEIFLECKAYIDSLDRVISNASNQNN